MRTHHLKIEDKDTSAQIFTRILLGLNSLIHIDLMVENICPKKQSKK
jgi:hypothetical protein